VVHPSPPEDGDSTGPTKLKAVFIRPATESAGTVAMHEVSIMKTIEDFKNEYCANVGVSPEFCRLIYGGKMLASVDEHGKGSLKPLRVLLHCIGW
jgi:hypothetical protein